VVQRKPEVALPPNLKALALSVGIDPLVDIPDHPAMPRRGKQEKVATPSAWDGAVDWGSRLFSQAYGPTLEEEQDRVLGRIR
jgi:hypothetical protein